eukprot:TRINITY_DN5156_c1_g1_i2.p1 TRINITY_DN5156_c1_g1~~TRINITY_DN5156_c1_g1_i2.p1  ORF type:complete len:175 (-),score=31.69 TRINITY_DN5156_c1_g1_i2:239-763(-)
MYIMEGEVDGSRHDGVVDMESESRTREAYRECLRNHAASLGSYATDGCGEFTPDGLTCAACGCHRNFHRKIIVGDCYPLRTASFEAAERSGGKKRVRTKFSAEQKEKMLRFAEKIGWRIQRKEGEGGGEDDIEGFCREIGVSRQVFKVWMHNHKNSCSTSASASSISDATALTQ